MGELWMQAWADRCGIDITDERVQEASIVGWPEKFKDWKNGWDAAIRAADARSKPVAYAIQSLRDGGIMERIAPVSYSMFQKNLDKLRSDPWVVNGVARIVPLFLQPPSYEEARSEALESCVSALRDACHATAIYGDEPPQMYLNAIDKAERALKHTSKVGPAVDVSDAMAPTGQEPPGCPTPGACSCSGAETKVAHTDHPLRHWDRSCPACWAETAAPAQAQGMPALQRAEWHSGNLHFIDRRDYNALRAYAERVAGERDALQARLNWAANELLACDYGDNPERKGVGWIVFGWRDVNGIYSVVPENKVRRIYGSSINEAIDRALSGGKNNG